VPIRPRVDRPQRLVVARGQSAATIASAKWRWRCWNRVVEPKSKAAEKQITLARHAVSGRKFVESCARRSGAACQRIHDGQNMAKNSLTEAERNDERRASVSANAAGREGFGWSKPTAFCAR